MGYSYKGSISFGLVYIPITLQNPIRNNDIDFVLLDKKTMSRIRYKKVSDKSKNREVKAEDIVRAYEYEAGRYVIFDDDDFEKIKNLKDKSITIEKFVDLTEVDPIYFNRPYYVVPTGAEKAFLVLLTAMEEENKAGLARVVLGNKEKMILIHAKDGKMLLNTLFFNEEIKSNNIGIVDANYTKKELELARDLIRNLSGPFDIENYVDEYKLRVEKAIETKISGKKITTKKEKAHKLSSNLIDALKMSLDSSAKSKRKSVSSRSARA